MLRTTAFLFCILGLFEFANAYSPGINCTEYKAYKPLQDLQSQVKDDSSKKEHSPTKAAIYSAVLPGLGQIYNRKYVKAGLVYGLLGVSTYFMIDNRKTLQNYKSDINAETDNDPNTIKSFFPLQSLETLKANRDVFKQNRDYAIIAMGLVYVLNIVDATVDAHLFEFNLNQKLSGHLEPQINPYGMSGARLTISF